ncbi:MAG: histidine phosphatase family protein, partial [Dolichospermum sp.]
MVQGGHFAVKLGLCIEERKKMTRVIIVRHGQSTYNIEKRIQGRTDASS